MENYKNLQIHLLPTNNSSEFGIIHEANQLHFITNDNTFLDNLVSYRELYITDDSEIKENDWVIKLNSNTLFQCSNSPFLNTKWLNSEDVKDCKKVIATTDKALKLISLSHLGEGWKDISLSQIPTQYIQHYISEYNKGNQLKTVDVLFECLISTRNVEIDFSDLGIGYNTLTHPVCREERLKLNSNNEITIKPVKESWNREEISKLLLEFAKDCDKDKDLIRHYSGEYRDLNNWIKQNL